MKRASMRGLLVTSLIVVAVIGVAVIGVAQESLEAPEETDIILPTRLLEIEDLRVERVEAVLPDPPDIVPPELAFPLPTDTELTISDEAFQVPDLPSDVASVSGREASVYSTGSVGFGTMNQVSGALRIYKLGTDPRFNFAFTHDSLDGYDLRPAGTGFFSTGNSINGWVGASSDTTSFESSASYQSLAEGLQGKSSYYSVETQFVTGGAQLEYRPDPRVRLDADMTLSSARRLLTVPDTEGSASLDREFHIAPSAGVALELSQVTAALKFGYMFRGVSDLSALHVGTFDFVTDVVASDSLFFELGLGVFWIVGDRVEYPFRLGASFSIRDRFTVGITGGFEVDPVIHADLWREISLASLGAAGSLTLPTRWFVTSTVAWNVVPEEFVVEGGVDYAFAENVVSTTGWDGAASEFVLTQGDVQDVSTRLEGRWSPVRGISLTLGGMTRILDRRILDPSTELSLGARYSTDNDSVSLGAAFSAPVYDSFVAPTFGIDGSVRVADGVDLVLEASDLLSPLTESGRAKHAGRVDTAFPFIDPGLRVILKAQLSL